ncbi:AMP-binding protein [Kribbella sp. NPDC051770]|uniref:AMP-binding protein n=1 Tax=Kribbella sp. NPDC051770 TaxID=3155413 RepID=UPI003414B029
MGSNRTGLLDWLESPAGQFDFLDDRGTWQPCSLPELAACTNGNAARLRSEGVGRDDRVVVLHRTGPAFAVSFFAALAAGGTPCPLAPPLATGYAERWLEGAARVISASDARLVVTDPELAELATEAVRRSGRPAAVIEVDLSAAADFSPQAAAELALVQFTSGSRATPRGVRVSWQNIEANIDMIYRWIGRPATLGTSWLPLHHDMGLVGGFLVPLVQQLRHGLMRPEHFIKNPMTWLERYGSGFGEVIVMPNFGYDYVVRRVSPEQLTGLDFSAVSVAVSGAERVRRSTLDAFYELLGPFGLTRKSMQPAYGLAEATLAVTGVRFGEPPLAVGVPRGSDRQGAEIAVVAETAADRWADEPATDDLVWHVSCGRPLTGIEVTIVDDSGQPLGDRVVGEIAVRAPSVAQGYTQDVPGSSTRFVAEQLLTGDAGFRHRGELFVLGRIGDSLQVRGRNVYVEDVESALHDTVGRGSGRTVVLAGSRDGIPTICLLSDHEISAADLDSVRQRVGEVAGSEVPLVLVRVRRSALEYTSSGKPRRASMWNKFLSGELAGAVVVRDPLAS